MHLFLTLALIAPGHAGAFSAYESHSVQCADGRNVLPLKPGRAARVCRGMYVEFKRTYDLGAAASAAERSGSLEVSSDVVFATIDQLDRFHRDAIVGHARQKHRHACNAVRHQGTRPEKAGGVPTLGVGQDGYPAGAQAQFE